MRQLIVKYKNNVCSSVLNIVQFHNSKLMYHFRKIRPRLLAGDYFVFLYLGVCVLSSDGLVTQKNGVF